jgi:uncharacterized short protein YbdD (DUF466 family)|tara:strand:- start:373 stop:597 length:225 start_codon:yes stop_codon:yes gene_type:complete
MLNAMTETEESYYNAYQLLVGKTDYDKLAEQEVFYLPENHEDPEVTLRYYESIEDYEKCNQIIKSNEPLQTLKT